MATSQLSLIALCGKLASLIHTLVTHVLLVQLIIRVDMAKQWEINKTSKLFRLLRLFSLKTETMTRPDSFCNRMNNLNMKRTRCANCKPSDHNGDVIWVCTGNCI